MTNFSFLGTFNIGYEDFSKYLAILCVVAGGTQRKTSLAAGLTKQIADELTPMDISFARISTSRIASGGGCIEFIQ